MVISDQGVLSCPTCGGGFTHLVGFTVDSGGHAGRLDAHADFTCEHGCLFTMTLHQYKGRTIVTAGAE